MTAEGLQDRAARVGRELEAAAAVKLVDAAHEGQVSLADEVSEVDFREANPSGHRQHQPEVGFGKLLAVLLGNGVPLERGKRLGQRWRA